MGSWVSILNDARDKLLQDHAEADDLQFKMELEGVRQSIRNLMTYDFVADAVDAGKLTLQGAYFGIVSAKLLLADDKGEFSEVKSA